MVQLVRIFQVLDIGIAVFHILCVFQELKCSRLDGSMGYEDRQKNIESFNDEEDVRIFLLSTRAGGLVSV